MIRLGGMSKEEAQKYIGKRISFEPTACFFDGDKQISYDRTAYARIVGFDGWDFDAELETGDEYDGRIEKVTQSRVRNQLKDKV